MSRGGNAPYLISRFSSAKSSESPSVVLLVAIESDENKINVIDWIWKRTQLDVPIRLYCIRISVYHRLELELHGMLIGGP